MSKLPTKTIQKILQDFATILDMDICFHDRLGLGNLPRSWTKHTCQPCVSFKSHSYNEHPCIEFDVRKVHELLVTRPAAQIVRCPAKYSQIVAGVFTSGLFVGVIFVGPFWQGRSTPPHEKLIWIKNKSKLDAKLTVVDALATELGKHLQDASVKLADRRQIILRFIQSHYAGKVCVIDLAKHMNLSPSRTGHIVKDLFGLTFPELITQTRLQEATRLLSASDWPISEIASMVGYDDQNYFSRIFTNKYRKSPRAYRKKHRTGI